MARSHRVLAIGPLLILLYEPSLISLTNVPLLFLVDHRISNSAPQPSADLFADSLAHLDGRSHLGKSETLTGGNRGNRSGDSAGRTCSQPSAAAYSDAPEANTSPSCATLLSAH